MTYLRGDDPPPEGCLFCVKPTLDDAEVHILYRGRFCYVILNRYPYNSGHLMVIPFAHLSSIEDMDGDTMAEFWSLTQHSLRLLREAYNPQGFNVGINIGAAAGAGVAGHVHLHIVPRWSGDTNYMTTLSNTRVAPEMLEQTFARLRPLFERLETKQ